MGFLFFFFNENVLSIKFPGLNSSFETRLVAGGKSKVAYGLSAYESRNEVRGGFFLRAF